MIEQVVLLFPVGGHSDVIPGVGQPGQLSIQVVLPRVHVDQKVALAAVQPFYKPSQPPEISSAKVVNCNLR